jgi:predicted TIM-barrel fold metal-dependent hydrolase
MVIDVHLHVFDVMAGSPDGRGLFSLTYGRAKSGDRVVQVLPPSFQDSSSKAELALAYMDMVGVDKAVLVQGSMYGSHNEYVARAVSLWPDRFFGTAWVHPKHGKKAALELRRWVDRGMRGFKMEVTAHRAANEGWSLTDDNAMRVWKTCEELGLICFLHMSSAQEDADALDVIVGECPRLKIVLCHCAGATTPEKATTLMMAKKRPNIYADFSGFPAMVKGEYPYPEALKAIQWIVNNVGAEKLMWGTDYPSLLKWCTYQQCLNLIKTQCTFLSPEQLDQILGGTAEKLLATAEA